MRSELVACLLLQLQSLLASEGSTTRSLFMACDADSNKELSFAELETCLAQASINNDIGGKLMSPKQFMSMVDANGDGKIADKEYHDMLLNARGAQEGEGDEEVDLEQGTVQLETRDGKVQTITRQELFGLLEKQVKQTERIKKGKEIKAENKEGKSTVKMKKKDVEEEEEEDEEDEEIGTGSGTVKELANKRPEMARYIGMANWALDMLQQQKEINSEARLKHLQTLPKGGSPFRGKEDGAQVDAYKAYNEAFEVWLEVATAGKNGRRYEFHIERNVALIRRPHLALKGAWQLDARGKRKKALTVPTIRLKRTKEEENVLLAFVAVIAAAFALFVASCCRFYVYNYNYVDGRVPPLPLTPPSNGDENSQVTKKNN